MAKTHEISGEKSTNSSEIITFGSIRYLRQSGELQDVEGNKVPLRRQSADVLAVLVENAGSVVDKEMLIESVWSGVATTDDSLVQCIADIRRILGREAIETFPRKGYRLNVVRATEKTVEPTDRSARKWFTAIGGVVLLIVAGSLMMHASQVRKEFSAPSDDASEKVLAVLPFVNLGGNTDTTYFGSGLGEDLTTDLSKVSGLTVISYTSSLGYADVESGFREIALELGADFLVRGTVRQQQDNLRINVSLIDPVNGLNLWADRYDRPADNLFEVQAEVAREIIQALSLTLDVKPENRRITPEAHKMLLRGYERQRELSPLANEEARFYFKRALAFDPEYARAHASVAVTYGRSAILNATSNGVSAYVDNGLRSAVTAIQLDSDLPLAYFSIGLLNLAIKDYDKALAAARHSIELDANFADGYALLAETALYGGDLNEALYSIRRAKLLHPHHPPSYLLIEGSVLYQLNRFDDAQEYLIDAVELNPEFPQGIVTLAANYGRLGEIDQAKTLLAQAIDNASGFNYEDILAQIPFKDEKRKRALRLGLLDAK